MTFIDRMKEEHQELTEKQRYQREYYARNRAKICAKKREQYEPKERRPRKKVDPEKTKVDKNITISQKQKTVTLPSKTKQVNKASVKTRRSAEDIRLARELGIRIEDLD